MNQRTNFCLYHGANAAKLSDGWRPASACSGEPGCAEDHVHISAATFERLQGNGVIVLWDEQLCIVGLKAKGEHTEAPASTFDAASIPHRAPQPAAHLW